MPFGMPGQIGWESIAEMLNPDEWEGFLKFFRGDPEKNPHIQGADPLYDLRDKAFKNERESIDRLGDDMIANIVGQPEGIPLDRPTQRQGEPDLPSGRSLSGPEVEEALKYQPTAFTMPTDPRSLAFDEKDPMRARALAAIQKREEEEREAPRREAERQKLLEAAGRESQQREFMSGTVPLIEDYDKRIAIGGQPNRGSAEDIMFRIRAEARAKGRGGDLRGSRPTEEDYRASVTPTGGSFITSDMTPELQQRLDERDAWTAEQPMRDAAFALSPQQLRRSPEGGAGAEYLRRIGQDQMETVRRERASQMLQKFVGPSGKIPADAARKLAMMDPIFAQIIPPDAIGMSREQASEMINAELMSAQQIAMSSAGDITDMAKPLKTEFVNRVYPLAEAARKRLAMGEDPELVWQDYSSKISAINYELMQSPVFQQMIGPTQTVAGE